MSEGDISGLTASPEDAGQRLRRERIEDDKPKWRAVALELAINHGAIAPDLVIRGANKFADFIISGTVPAS